MSVSALDPLSPLKAPIPNAAEILANRTYEALMWALARPGTVQTLPSDDLAAIAETLVDRECRVFAGESDLAARIAAMGAEIVAAAQADHALLALDTATGLAALREVPTGTHLYPDEGATVFAAAAIGTGQRLRLSGPGIETSCEIALGGLPEDVWSIRASRCLYPTGFELFLIDGNKVIGIPRSTTIEVL
ncbi:phosphonate C-P lyase system protein PhnH [Rhizobium sp. RU36D]|uniref:phosphonate C-P lyase system protein PhnH n=1 Tax=Rhizobium sp. RU36D TaxID=1907415 RepID=UPI0009D82B36|nr:phosphonate C-P lyase system protein PhnH [Rhizobium sp. RU36D]SMC70728.1 alpha-D-ribose 1-methylphosphonate 5-triphosphate synthase subunit PhnH [Rhizobium sp. RU36D]